MIPIRARKPALPALLAVSWLLAGSAGPASAEGRILIVNANAAGIGLNDPTPAAPVGGNDGATRGQQRLNVLRRAAAAWEAALRPEVDIEIVAAFTLRPPGVLATAAPGAWHANFEGAEIPDTWYPIALANNLAREDLLTDCDVTFCWEALALFSIDADFYLGYDHQEAPGQADLLVQALHHFGRTLGFANTVTASGALPLGIPDVFTAYTLDATAGLPWPQMSDAGRLSSATNVRNVVWTGRNVTRAVPDVLEPGSPGLRIAAPVALEGLLPVGAAAFGPPLAWPGVSGEVALATYAGPDGSPASDGCSPITSDVAGKVAMVDRGTCAFTVKARNAQAAGAIAMLVADTVQQSPPPGMGGADAAVVIPCALIARDDADAIRSHVPVGVHVTLGIELPTRAGTHPESGQVLLAATHPGLPSQLARFDNVARPDQLMELAPAPDLEPALGGPDDLTIALMTDLGWFSDHDGVPDGRDQCIQSDAAPTIVLGDCDSGVVNRTSPVGCTASDALAGCDGSGSHSQYVHCILETTDRLIEAGLIAQQDKGRIVRCAGGAH